MKRFFNLLLMAVILAGSMITVNIPVNSAQAAQNTRLLMSPYAWNALGSGLNGVVYGIAVNGTDIYVGGQFTDAGGDSNADRIAKWDGSSWSALGSGISNGQVNSIVVFAGSIYVGGTFTDAGGNANADYLARWDGSNWSSVGNGLSSDVNVIGVDGSNFYVGGDFLNAGGVAAADYIAKLDGGSWESLGATSLNGPIYSMVVAGATVYAGGDFLNAGGDANADRIAQWDGTSWSALGTGLSDSVLAIARSDGNLYASGLFVNAGGNANADYIAKWDGSAWSALGSGLNSYADVIAVDGSNLYVGGNFLNAGGDANADYIAKWDGTSWSALGTTALNSGGTVTALAINGLNIYAGGTFDDAGGNSGADKVARFELTNAPLVTSFTALSSSPGLDIPITSFSALDNQAVAAYLITESPTEPAADDASWSASVPNSYTVVSDGSYTLYPWAKDAADNVSAVYASPVNVNVDTTPPTISTNVWNPLGSGLSNTVYDLAASGNDLYTVGSFLDAGSFLNGDRVAKWNGTSWSPLGSGLNAQTETVTINGTSVYAGGNFLNAGGDANADYVAQWNGSSWSNVGNSPSGTVFATAISGSDIFIGGGFTNAGANPNADYIAKLNNGIWESLGTTPLNGNVFAVAIDGSNVYVGGAFTSAGGKASANYIAKWNGSSWSALGGGLNNWVKTIIVNNGNVYVGGSFTDAGGDTNADYIAKWNGTSWSAVGGGLNNTVTTIALSGSDIYAGGLFTDAGGNTNADYIAKWNGSSWSALGSTPLNGTVYSIVVNGPYLYAGGAFTDAGNNPNADRIALFVIDTATPTVTSFTAPSSSNNLDVPITAFTATDDIAVTGYLINESSTPPSASDAGWSASAPTTYTVGSDGSHTLYPWVKDGLGNVSAVYGSPATVTVDTSAPTITSFTVTSLSNSLNIPITAFSASDASGVVGYLITKSNTPPALSDSGWTVSAPTTYHVGSNGSYILYPWVKDAAGNISAVYGTPANVTVDATKPTVTGFSVPASSASLNISITTFTASDNVAVTGYLITASNTAPLAGAVGWTALAPSTYHVGSSGSYTLYPWVKDAAGNVSAVYGSPVSVNVDTTAPTVTSFAMPSTSNSLDISIADFTASDNTGLNGYLITESATPPSAGAAGWTVSAPTTYTVASSGSYTLYPWARDVAGNISALYASPASVTVDTTADVIAPTVDAFTVPGSSTGLDIPITTFTASDNVTVSKYLITESATPPSPTDAGWMASAPAYYTVLAEGAYTLYPWVKDTAGNISTVYSMPVTVEVTFAPPTILNINRYYQTPNEITDADSLVFYVHFYGSVLNVDPSDFIVTGGTTATVTNVSSGADSRLVTVSGGDLASFNGTVGLDISPTQDIIGDSTGKHLVASIPNPNETYTVVNPKINITLGGISQGFYNLASGSSTRQSFKGMNNGPVELESTSAINLLAAERVIYKVNGTNTSYSEMMALPDSQLTTTYWLPWYNNVDLDTQLRIGNVSGTPAQVHVFIAGNEVNGSPFNLSATGNGQSLRLSFPNVNSGPVQIVADQNIVAAERVIYKVNGTNTSFSELMALPDNQLTTTYWLPWYNNADLDTQLRIGNVSGNPAQVHVFIAGNEVNGSPFNLSATGTGQSLRLSFPNVNSGPVQIVADQNIVAAERVIYKVNGTNTSFSELMALPDSQLTTTYWLPWYNNVDLDTQLRIGNVSGSTATVHIFIGGTEVTPVSGVTLLNGASTRVSYPSVNRGPVQMVSDQPIVVAERVIYKVNNINTSFSEMMGLPGPQLNTIYWLPWYNNVDLDTQLRFGLP